MFRCFLRCSLEISESKPEVAKSSWSITYGPQVMNAYCLKMLMIFRGQTRQNFNLSSPCPQPLESFAIIDLIKIMFLNKKSCCWLCKSNFERLERKNLLEIFKLTWIWPQFDPNLTRIWPLLMTQVFQFRLSRLWTDEGRLW